MSSILPLLRLDPAVYPLADEYIQQFCAHLVIAEHKELPRTEATLAGVARDALDAARARRPDVLLSVVRNMSEWNVATVVARAVAEELDWLDSARSNQ